MVESATPTLVRSRNRGRGVPMTLTETRAAGSSAVTPSRMLEAGGHLVGDDARPRVVVVFEDQYRSYREVIARALKSLRPHAKVSVAGLDALDAEIERVAPDLVICSSDWLAQGVIVEALSRGLLVPEDLGVVGFGNLGFAAEMEPPITTVHVHGEAIGNRAVEALVARAAGEEVQPVVDVGFSILPRGSTR